MNLLRVAGTILLCMAPLLLVAAEPTPKVVAFNTSVQVEVDATGKPARVEAMQDLPQAVRRFIEARVASWQYEPATRDGVPVPATTYVQLAACAMPTADGEGLTLAADFEGNGPRSAGGRLMPPLRYPEEAQKRGESAEFVLVVDVGTDGKAGLGTIEKVEGSTKGRTTEFEVELRRWTKTLRFDPEQVAGLPVAGQVRIPVSFESHADPDWRARREEQLAKTNASRECQMARGAGSMRPVAVESVVRVTPVPAG